MKLFNIDLSNEQQNIINSIKIDKSIDPFRYSSNGEKIKGWTSFNGNLNKYIQKGIKETNADNSDGLSLKASEIISKIFKKAIIKLKENMKIENYNFLLFLRFQRENDMFTIPTYHIDDNMIIDNQTTNINQKKIIISLKGPGTLLAKCNKNKNSEVIDKIKHYGEKYLLIVNEEINKDNMKKFNDKIYPILKNKCELYQLKQFQGVIYNVGDNNKYACIHAQPNMIEPRIILIIVVNEII